ncbi:hypothetical protein RRG08_042553 [Elysia crispata]|uniref:Uncharacterized protein n=1 Tax=Elysia crispata TaxID=231223 RepID=A0AAE1CKL0_9GAST|nr:hypothetical protein RRG08_042553 [Elysia crispata]
MVEPRTRFEHRSSSQLSVRVKRGVNLAGQSGALTKWNKPLPRCASAWVVMLREQACPAIGAGNGPDLSRKSITRHDHCRREREQEQQQPCLVPPGLIDAVCITHQVLLRMVRYMSFFALRLRCQFLYVATDSVVEYPVRISAPTSSQEKIIDFDCNWIPGSWLEQPGWEALGIHRKSWYNLDGRHWEYIAKVGTTWMGGIGNTSQKLVQPGWEALGIHRKSWYNLDGRHW